MTTAVRPETLRQAQTWDQMRSAYVRAGLCAACAAQAAWGHQLGFGHVASRPRWPEADRRIKPPCGTCAPIVAGFPVAKRGGWRALDGGRTAPWAQNDDGQSAGAGDRAPSALTAAQRQERAAA